MAMLFNLQRRRSPVARSLTVVIGLVAIAGSPLLAQEYQKLKNEGVRAYRDGRYREATDFFREALKQKKTAEVYRFLGHSEFNLKNYRRAETAFRRALARNADLKKLHLFLGQIYMKTDRDDRARKAFRKALAGGITTENVYRTMGGLLERIGQRDLALAAYRMALLRAEEATGLRVRMVQLLLSLENDREAFRQAKRLTEQHPANTDYQLLLARAAIQVNRLDEAERALTRADLLGSTRPVLFRTLADVQVNQHGHYREAVRLYRIYFSKTDDPSPEDHYRFGLALMKTEEFDGAETHLIKAVQERTSYTDGLLRLARTLHQTRGYEEARSVLKKLTELDSNVQKAWIFWGNRLMERDNPEAALAKYRKAYELGRRKENLLINYSLALLKSDHRETARKVLSEALAEYPENDTITSTVQKWVNAASK